jgi:GDPmannose 4,6-dehydratase/GDP-4-dehydro-6-deoxy-D-mannose reductase
MKTLITGITGSGGSYLAEYIVNNKKDVKVCGTSRWHTTGSHKNLKSIYDKVDLISCDLCDFPNLYRILDKERPDVIFHIASLANVRDAFDNTFSTYLNNVTITINLLEAIRTIKDYNPIVQLCSTSEVYGLVSEEEIPISENNEIKPINPYASSKLAQDNLGYVYHKSYGLNIIRTRMFAYLNARRKDLFASAFAKQIIEIENGEKDILKHGNLNSVRTLIDVRDAMESYWIATEKCISGEAYNIGGETAISVGDFLNLLIKNSKVDIQTEQCPKLTRPVDVTLQIPDCSKFKKATGWEPKYSFEESVQYFLEEIRKEYK